MISANHAATSARDAGDHGDGGTSPELLGTALQTVVCDGVWLYGELEEWRIHGCQRMELGWPVAAVTASWAAAGARASSGSRLQWSWRCEVSIYGVYAAQRGRWTLARD